MASHFHRLNSNVLFTIVVALGLWIGPAQCAPGKERLPAFPLPVDQQRSQTARFLSKPVLASRLVDDMEDLQQWRSFGPGKMTLTPERSHDGTHSLRLTSPTKGAEKPAVQGRPFGESGVRREVTNEDWSAFNRISVWVYPDLRGFHTVSLLMKLDSEGTRGRSYTDGGMNFVLLRNQEWNHVVWEIPHLDRRQVQGLELIYRLQGNEPGAANHVLFDFDQLELQRVQPDPFEGWAPARIAMSQVGYPPRGPKVALAPATAGEPFEIVDAITRNRVWEGSAATLPRNDFSCATLDFGAFEKPGTYRLRIGGLESAPFQVTKRPWREPLLAGLNFFFCERCGFAVPGIHDVCHQDWRVQHNGQSLVINGGWHDAGDLSQGLVNTAEAVWSMLRLAERLQASDPDLAQRFLQEARWGAEWLLKTRFGDGFRVTWATMDFWTDGIPGDVDDVTVKAGDSAFENFLAAQAEAAFFRSRQKSETSLAGRCLRAAEVDYAYAVKKAASPNLELAAAAAQASIELFRATGSQAYAKDAERFADVILACQQSEPTDWQTPFSGFFYTSPKRDRLLHYNHRSHEQAPIVALVDLCVALPANDKAPAWRVAILKYGHYLLSASRYTAPYNMIPAGLYRLADTADAAQQQQIRQGIPVDRDVYLRRFPVWGDFRGNLGVLLSQATAAAAAGRFLNSPELTGLAREQLEWTLGRNPFAQSLMYGVGEDYAPQYTAMSGDMTGSLPVGIQSRLERDAPYWPRSNCYNYAEVWVHPVSRFFSTIAELGE